MLMSGQDIFAEPFVRKIVPYGSACTVYLIRNVYFYDQSIYVLSL